MRYRFVEQLDRRRADYAEAAHRQTTVVFWHGPRAGCGKGPTLHSDDSVDKGDEDVEGRIITGLAGIARRPGNSASVCRMP